jgi:hypothetical protein
VIYLDPIDESLQQFPLPHIGCAIEGGVELVQVADDFLRPVLW